MSDLAEVTKIVNELNELEHKKDGKSFEDRLKLLDIQSSLWKTLYDHIGGVVCKCDLK
jgi:hypothetical protein